MIKESVWNRIVRAVGAAKGEMLKSKDVARKIKDLESEVAHGKESREALKEEIRRNRAKNVGAGVGIGAAGLAAGAGGYHLLKKNAQD